MTDIINPFDVPLESDLINMSISNAEGKPDIVILDAPGINGAGGLLSQIRFFAYVEAGGPCCHPIEPSAEHIAKVACAVEAADQAVAEYELRHSNS